jgi:thiol-disulfide isomerase/thioredoxin
MKQLFYFLCVLFTLSTHAQTTGNKVSLNEKTVVKDSSGITYPYAIWQKLVQTGEYSLKPLNIKADLPEFLLFKLSEAEMKARDERMPKPKESAYFKTGSTISNAKLVTLDRKKYNLKELAGKVVVLNFWFINCPPCRMEIPHLNKMKETYKDREDVVFLAVALDEAYDLKQFLKETPFNYGIVDGGRYIASQYGITSYPTHVVLDKEGKVTFHTSGYGMGTVPWLKKSIDTALGEKL